MTRIATELEWSHRRRAAAPELAGRTKTRIRVCPALSVPVGPFWTVHLQFTGKLLQYCIQFVTIVTLLILLLQYMAILQCLQYTSQYCHQYGQQYTGRSQYWLQYTYTYCCVLYVLYNVCLYGNSYCLHCNHSYNIVSSIVILCTPYCHHFCQPYCYCHGTQPPCRAGARPA